MAKQRYILQMGAHLPLAIYDTLTDSVVAETCTELGTRLQHYLNTEEEETDAEGSNKEEEA